MKRHLLPCSPAGRPGFTQAFERWEKIGTSGEADRRPVPRVGTRWDRHCPRGAAMPTLRELVLKSTPPLQKHCRRRIVQAPLSKLSQLHTTTYLLRQIGKPRGHSPPPAPRSSICSSRPAPGVTEQVLAVPLVSWTETNMAVIAVEDRHAEWHEETALSSESGGLHGDSN